MPEISPSAVNAQIPLSAQAPKVDPLALATQYGGLQGQMLNNRLLAGNIPIQAQQQQQATIKTGSDQQQFEQTQLDTFHKKASAASDLFLGLIANKDKQPLTATDIKSSVMNNLFGTGILDPRNPHDTQIASAVIGQLDPGDTPEGQAHNEMVLTRFYQQMHSGAEGYGLTLGQPTAVNTGPATVISRIGGVGQPTQGGATFEHQLSPQDKVGLTAPIMGADNVPHARSVGQVFDAYGNPLQNAAQGGAAPQAHAGPSGNGRYPGGAPAASGAAPGDLGPTALPPGAAMGMEQSTQAYQQATAAVPQLRRTLTTFDQALDALKKAPTGQGSEAFQNLRAVADTLGIPLPQAEKGKTVAYAEANKWLTSALTQEASRLGLGTDQARQLQADAQPGVHTVHDAALAMVPVLRGLKGMELAQPIIAQKQGVKPGDFNAWSAQWANSVDPMAFSPPQLTKEEWTAKRATMQKAGTWDRYKAGLDAALQAGVVTPAQIRK